MAYKPSKEEVEREKEYQLSRDVDTTMQYGQICDDPDRMNRVRSRLRKTSKMVSKGGRKSSR